MGTSVRMIELHYGRLVDGAQEAILARLEQPDEGEQRGSGHLVGHAVRPRRGGAGAGKAAKPASLDDSRGSGAYRDRTGDLRLAKPALSQLS
jgi:hypothetical protein